VFFGIFAFLSVGETTSVLKIERWNEPEPPTASAYKINVTGWGIDGL